MIYNQIILIFIENELSKLLATWGIYSYPFVCIYNVDKYSNNNDPLFFTDFTQHSESITLANSLRHFISSVNDEVLGVFGFGGLFL